jgi:hypothetical protein
MHAELSEAKKDSGEVPLANALVPYVRVDTTIFDSLVAAAHGLPFARSRVHTLFRDQAEVMVTRLLANSKQYDPGQGGLTHMCARAVEPTPPRPPAPHVTRPSHP